MDRAWRALLDRYGRQVAVTRREDGQTRQTAAFLQPLLEERTGQLAPSPLGLRREDRFLYLGPPDVRLTPGDRVDWGGQAFWVQSAHPVYIGGQPSHQWAVLRPRDKEGL